MIAALQARDGARMRKVLTQHLLNKRDVVMAQLAETAAAFATPNSVTPVSPAIPATAGQLSLPPTLIGEAA